MGIFDNIADKLKDVTGIDKACKCPYCLHEFMRSEAEEGEIRGYKFKICPNKDRDSNGRAVCGKRLPLRFFDSDSVVISLIGGAATGKTYYFMALKRILEDSEVNALGISGRLFFPPGDSASEQYYEKLQEQLNTGEPLDATSKDQGIEQAALVLEVNIDRNGKRKTVYFTFYDNPGEGFNDEDYIIRNMNVHRSDAVIFLLAPEQIRQLLPYLNGEGTGQTTKLNNVIGNMVNILGGDGDEDGMINWVIEKFHKSKIDIPVAFCFSKYDLIDGIFNIIIPHDLDETEFGQIIDLYNKSANYDEIDYISNSIREQIYNLRIYHLINNIPSSFSNYHYFGIQSIEDTGNGFRLKPRGASLPIIWILKQLDLL